MSERFSANPNNPDKGADHPHVARYLLARGFIMPGETVVDAACGPGYGSALLAEVAGKVIGIDKADTWDLQWFRDNISFVIADLEKDIPVKECDAWVSIETIEHLADPELYLSKVTAVTKRVMVFSSPNKETKHLHEYHLSDVLITNMQHYMQKYPDWIEFHSFIQGQTWILIYVNKNNFKFI